MVKNKNKQIKMPRGKYNAEFVKPLNRDYMDKIAEQGQKEMVKNKNPFSRKELEKIYKRDKTIISLVKNSLYHYDMLLALQTQIMCLEAKIKILETK